MVTSASTFENLYAETGSVPAASATELAAWSAVTWTTLYQTELTAAASASAMTWGAFTQDLTTFKTDCATADLCTDTNYTDYTGAGVGISLTAEDSTALTAAQTLTTTTIVNLMCSQNTGQCFEITSTSGAVTLASGTATVANVISTMTTGTSTDADTNAGRAAAAPATTNAYGFNAAWGWNAAYTTAWIESAAILAHFRWVDDAQSTYLADGAATDGWWLVSDITSDVAVFQAGAMALATAAAVVVS